VLPGNALAASATLSLGAVLGPEAPLIALGAGLAGWVIGLAGRPPVPGPWRKDRHMTEEAYPSSVARRGWLASGMAVGFILFAAIMLLMVGVFQALQGLIGIFENEFYVQTRNYLFQFDATTWGWIHLVLGLLVAFAGWGLLSGRTWAWVVGITLAVLGATANFLFIPYYPIWSTVIITLDVLVIWAIAAHGGELRERA
jgi:hypothetical protein